MEERITFQNTALSPTAWMCVDVCCSDLGESILQWTDGIAGTVSRKADLLSLSKRLGWNPVQVSIANPTSKTEEENRREINGLISPSYKLRNHPFMKREFDNWQQDN